MTTTQKIYVAGHRGMVGSAIVRQLRNIGCSDLIQRTHEELDLTDQAAVRNFFEIEKPDQVYLAAARVGGINANNTYPAEFIYQNLMIETNIIHEAWRVGVKKILFLGSSCIYPKHAQQPMNEEALLTSTLEATNEPYAIAKIAGIKLCESYNRQYGESDGVDYRSVMPTNLYGPQDNYDLLSSHVISAMIRKLHLAKLASMHDWIAIEHDESIFGAIPEDLKRQLYNVCNLNYPPCISLWGTGAPRREFLYVDDMACACVHVMNLDRYIYTMHTEPMLSHINVGCNEDVTIAELAQIVGQVVGYEGKIIFDSNKPDGAPRKLMDSSRLKMLGWEANIALRDGLAFAYRDFLKTSLCTSNGIPA